MGTGSKKYGIGVVGCGTISDTHAKAIAETGHGKLIAAHSRTRANLNAFCNTYGTVGYIDYEEFLAHDGLDIVVILTPSGTHLDYGNLAAHSGKHLIVEKPIEVTLGRGRALIAGCRENKVKLAVIYQNRFIDDVVKMKHAVDNNELGKLLMVDASVNWFRAQKYYDSAAWRGTLSLDGGGVVVNQAIHTIDLMLWFAGDIESVYAFKGTFTHERMEGEDNAVAVVQFKNGVIGTFRASTSVVPSRNRKIELFGAKGTAVLDGDVFRLMKSKKDLTVNSSGARGSGSSSALTGMTTNYHKKQYDRILEAFRNDTEPMVSGEESLKSLAVVKALYKSARIKEPVYLKDF